MPVFAQVDDGFGTGSIAAIGEYRDRQARLQAIITRKRQDKSPN
jgi:hypothetical protein